MHPFWILMSLLETDMATIPKNQQFRSLFYEKLQCAKNQRYQTIMTKVIPQKQ
jgi:hypothetical protein